MNINIFVIREFMPSSWYSLIQLISILVASFTTYIKLHTGVHNEARTNAQMHVRTHALLPRTRTRTHIHVYFRIYNNRKIVKKRFDFL